MDRYVIAKENLERLNEWTCTMYTLIHALKTSKDRGFEPKDQLNESGLDAMSWEKGKNNFNSITHRITNKSKRKMKFRRDPVENFDKTVRRIIYMLIQDLVIIFDEILNDLIVIKNVNHQNFPQSKVESLKKYVDEKYEWSIKGCMELIAVRNAITHSRGNWNNKSLAILVDNYIITEEKSRELNSTKVFVSFPMVFEYKKSIRTFINQVKVGELD